MPPRLVPFLVIAMGAAGAWAMVGTGFANYDTAYALLWGDDLAHGRGPDYSVPVAPTPHPLATAVGALLSPLGDRAETAVVVMAFAFLGGFAYATYAIGARAFGPAAGALAALIVLTREPVLSFGVRAYVDIPYAALVLGAAALEMRRRRAGLPVLALLAIAGLLRPEAWLFAAAYWVWLALDPERDTARLARAAAVAAAAPAVWALADLLVTGDALHSLTGTRENAEVLERRTGLDEVPVTVPRRLGEILREPVLLGAALGGPLALAFLRRRATLPVALGAVALGAFCVLAAAGLPILGRYLLLPAAVLAVFCAAGALGWRHLDRDHPWRRRWLGAAALTGIALAAFTPRQVERIADLRGAIGLQREIRDDLHALAPVLRERCGPVAVPNHRPVPLLALWLDRRPDTIVSAQLRRPPSGTFVAPASPRVERNFILDKNDPGRLSAAVPAGFRRVAANRSWVIHERC